MSKLIKVEKDGNTLEVTEKAHRVVYAPKGYKEVKPTRKKATKKEEE
jgi:hypothetical protein